MSKRENELVAHVAALKAELDAFRATARGEPPEVLKGLLAAIVARVAIHWANERRPIAYASLSQNFSRSLRPHGGFAAMLAMLADTGFVRIVENLSSARFVFPADVVASFHPTELARWREYGVRADRLTGLRARAVAAGPSADELAAADADALARFRTNAPKPPTQGDGS